MKNNEQFKKILRTMLKILLIFSETAVFAYIWLNHYNNFITAPFIRKGNWFFYLVYMIVFALFLCISKEDNDAYEKRYENPISDSLDI